MKNRRKSSKAFLNSILILFSLLVLASSVNAQLQPTLTGQVVFGGSGDQHGSGVVVNGSQIFVVGQDGNTGLVRRYSGSLGNEDRQTSAGNTFLNAVTASDTTVYPVGRSTPPTCGASDGVGDTEAKSSLSRYSSAGAFAGCGSLNYFSYRGHEMYLAALKTMEGSTEVVYAAGLAEEFGFGGWRTILAKYKADGALQWKRSYGSGSSGGSQTWGETWLNGYLYLVGHDQNSKAMLLKYDAAGQTPDPDPNVTGASPLVPAWVRLTTASGRFLGVTGLNGFLYAAGFAGNTSDEEYLLEKYDEDGNLLWSRTSGGAGSDVLTGIVTAAGRLFAVGYTATGGGAGGLDAVLLEIDPDTGDILSTTLFGDAQDDKANGVATDGMRLYVVGESKSFASAEGNVVGQNDGLVLEYTVALADNFKCYKVNGQAIQEVVSLSDQFETKQTLVMRPTALCTPVDKNGQGIVNRSTHLTCFSIKDQAGQPRFQSRKVEVQHPFGKQVLTVLKPQALCMPSTKTDLGSTQDASGEE